MKEFTITPENRNQTFLRVLTDKRVPTEHTFDAVRSWFVKKLRSEGRAFGESVFTIKPRIETEQRYPEMLVLVYADVAFVAVGEEPGTVHWVDEGAAV